MEGKECCQLPEIASARVILCSLPIRNEKNGATMRYNKIMEVEGEKFELKLELQESITCIPKFTQLQIIYIQEGQKKIYRFDFCSSPKKEREKMRRKYGSKTDDETNFAPGTYEK